MVEHQSQHSRFVLEQDGNECVLDYELHGTSVNFTHTYVPFRLRGKGLAEALAPGGSVQVATEEAIQDAFNARADA